jgi:hypothetical protein
MPPEEVNPDETLARFAYLLEYAVAPATEPLLSLVCRKCAGETLFSPFAHDWPDAPSVTYGFLVGLFCANPISSTSLRSNWFTDTKRPPGQDSETKAQFVGVTVHDGNN